MKYFLSFLLVSISLLRLNAQDQKIIEYPLNKISSEPSRGIFGEYDRKEIILVAPDIDADVFKNDIAPQMVSETKKPITRYVSADDLALKASKLLRSNPRTGDAGKKMVILEGTDSSSIDTSFLSYSYFTGTNSLILDIFDIIKSGQRALDRKRLSLIKLKNNTFYWKETQ